MTMIPRTAQHATPSRIVRTLGAALLASLMLAPTLLLAAEDDRDEDGILDPLDNCLVHANAYQRDTDHDGIGNRCDADFDQNGVVDSRDQVLLTRQFVFEGHGSSDNALRRGEPPQGEEGRGVWRRHDAVRARDFDLDGDGDVDPDDLRVFHELKGRAPGPRLDSDADGVADPEDPCWNTVEGATPVRSGCSALDVVERPEALTGPIRAVIEDLRAALLVGSATVAELRDVRLGLAAAVSALDDGTRVTRSGLPCDAPRLFGDAAAVLASSAGELGLLADRALASRPVIPDHGDTWVEADVARALGAWQSRLQSVEAAVHGVSDAVQATCDAGTPSDTVGRIARVLDDLGRIQLEDGRLVFVGRAASLRGVLAEGLEVELQYQDFGDGTALATDVIGADVLARIPAPRCLELRVAPVQPFGRYSSGPLTLHDPRGYEEAGVLQLEQGMALAAAASSLCRFDPERRYSLELILSYTTRQGALLAFQPLALDLVGGDLPVGLPDDMHPGVEASLTVNTYRRDCMADGTNCGPPQPIATDSYTLIVRERNAYCEAEYQSTLFDVNDQVPGDWRQTWVTSFFGPYGLGSAPAFGAQGYQMCPDGSGGFNSCAPQVDPIFLNHSFTIQNYDFAPIHPFLDVLGEIQAELVLAASGVKHASGLKWPHVRSQRGGFDYQYSCGLPEIVRDAVNICSGTDAFYRMPFEQGVTGWTQGQGNLSGCCGQPFDSNCCNSHNFSFAYDMVSACSTEIVAARAGRVLQVEESLSQQVTGSCFNGECPDHTCCADTSCGANIVIVLHQDGTFGRYLHVEPNGVVPDEGDLIRRGELLAFMGTTGPSSGPHLHFEVRDVPMAPSPPFGTILALFEAVHSGTSGTLTCYEPPDRPGSGDPLRQLRSNSLPWP